MNKQVVQLTFFQLILQYIWNKSNGFLCHHSNTTSSGTFLQAYLIYFFKHNLKLLYIMKFPELQNFYSAQSQLPPTYSTSRGSGGNKFYVCLVFKKTQTMKFRNHRGRTYSHNAHSFSNISRKTKQKSPVLHALCDVEHTYIHEPWYSVLNSSKKINIEPLNSYLLALLFTISFTIWNKSSYLVWY